jgi:hypothetical protein
MMGTIRTSEKSSLLLGDNMAPYPRRLSSSRFALFRNNNAAHAACLPPRQNAAVGDVDGFVAFFADASARGARATAQPFYTFTSPVNTNR